MLEFILKQTKLWLIKPGKIHYPNVEVGFMNEGTFDHTPGLLTIYPRVDLGKKHFRYFSMWRQADDYIPRVTRAWQDPIIVTKMFFVVQRLKLVKKELKELNKQGSSDVQAEDTKALIAMHEAQKLMHTSQSEIIC